LPSEALAASQRGLRDGFKTLDDLPGDLTGKVALVRVDLNLPMKDGAATDATRVRGGACPTILELAAKGAKVLLLAHFGRPKGSGLEHVDQHGDGDVGGCWAEVMFMPEIAGAVVAQAIGILRPAISPCWKTPASGRARKRTIPPFVPRHGRAWRFLRQRRLFRRAPRPCHHRRAGASAAGLCRALDGGRTEGAGKGAGRALKRRWRPWSAGPRFRPSSTC
jgi:hypothetical protein